MIYFKKLIANRLGMLNNQELTLGQGLHIIYQENEMGKSTWAALVKNLLFHIPRKGDAEYCRFSMDKGLEISMDLVIDGEEYNFYRKDAKAVAAVKKADGSKALAYCTKEPGHVIWDISKKTYANTLFLEQMQHMIVKDDQIEKRLARTAQNVEENGGNTFEEGIGALNKLLRLIDGRSKESKCQKLRLRKEELLKCIEENRQIYNDIFSYEKEIIDLENALEKAKKDVLAVEKNKLWENYKKASEYHERYMELERHAKEIKASVSQNGILPERDHCEYLKKVLLAYKELKRQYADAEGRQKDAEKEIETDREKIKGYDYFSRSDYFLKKQQAETCMMQSNMSENKTGILFYILAALFLLTGICGFVFDHNLTVLWIISIIICILFAISGNIGNKKQKMRMQAHKKEVDDFLIRTRCGSLEEVFLKEGEYVKLKSTIEVKQEGQLSICDEIERIEKECSSLKGIFETETIFKGMENNEDTMLFYINKIMQGLNDIETLEAEKEYADNMSRSFLGGKALEEVACMVENTGEMKNDRPAGNLNQEIDQLQDDLSNMKEKKAILKGRLERQDISVGELESQLDEADEKLKEYEYKKEVMEIAVQSMKEAQQIFSSLYAPYIAKELGEMMNELTQGKYDHASVSHDFEILLNDSLQSEKMGTVKLSKGAEELAWFALRMVLSKYAYEDDLPPLILDDPFVNLDDKRCEAVIRLLSKMSGERQIILFTCHKRLVEFAGNLHL